MLLHGVVAADGPSAWSPTCRSTSRRTTGASRCGCPGLDPSRSYTVTRIDPAAWPAYDVPTKGPVSGAALADVGLPGPPPAPLSVVVMHLQAAD